MTQQSKCKVSFFVQYIYKISKFQPNIPSHSGEKVDFNGFAIFSIGRHLGFSTMLTFAGLKPCSLIMLHVKFEIHTCSGLREKVI